MGYFVNCCVWVFWTIVAVIRDDFVCKKIHCSLNSYIMAFYSDSHNNTALMDTLHLLGVLQHSWTDMTWLTDLSIITV